MNFKMQVLHKSPKSFHSERGFKQPLNRETEHILHATKTFPSSLEIFKTIKQMYGNAQDLLSYKCSS